MSNQKGIITNIILIAVLLVVIAGSFYFFLRNFSKKPTISGQNQGFSSPVNYVNPSQQPIILPQDELTSINKLNAGALIKVAFVRDGNIYLYEDGQEKLISKPEEDTKLEGKCYDLAYPFVSPNGKYLAYLQQLGQAFGYGGCIGGSVRLVDIDTGKITALPYFTDYLDWNQYNQLLIQTYPASQYEVEAMNYVIYDPTTKSEIAKEPVNGNDRGFAIYNKNKIIRYKDKDYFLVDGVTGKEIKILDGNKSDKFRGWSPDGVYAIFRSKSEVKEPYTQVLLFVDTENLQSPIKKVEYESGSAGGDFGRGLKWYFNKAFVEYCSQSLYFLDQESLELTNDGGGGCHNEDGFVATSPNGEYAFIKFKDRFELHTKNGEKTKINESEEIAKGRGAPKNLIWINNDYMVIFGSFYGGTSNQTKNFPKIYLFDRKANLIKPIITNGYLYTSL